MRKKKNDMFSEVAEEWLEISRVQWKPSSTVKYRNILRLYLLPGFGRQRISEISKADVTRFGNELLISGGARQDGLSPKTVAGILSVLKNIFAYAEDMKGCTAADIGDISIRQPQKPMRILSRAEQYRLTEYLFAHRNACNLGILITLYTGMRIGEICALKWGDVLLEERCIFVRRTMQRLQTDSRAGFRTAVVVSAPKSDCSIRRIPIQRDILPILQQSYISDNSFLLTGMQGSCMEPRTMQNRFKQVIRDCGIASANYHALRHTFATRCVELGMDVKCLSEILGHASVNITLNRYVHPSMEWKQENMNRLSELLVVNSVSG